MSVGDMLNDGPTASGVDAELSARWRDAERRLYPLVLSAPDVYERALTLVRRVADELTTTTTFAELATRYERREALVRGAAENLRCSLAGIDMDAVAGAAFSLRNNELSSVSTRREALARLAKARAAGEAWAVVYESGRPLPDGDVVPPYHVIEANTARPVGLHAYAIFDMTSGEVSYGVSPLRIDAETGAWSSDDASPALERTHGDVTSWLASRDELRGLLLGDVAV